MPINIDIQNKVLKIVSNKAVNAKGKLAIRKEFYGLQIEQISLEEAQEDFNAKSAKFEAELDAILEQLKTISEPRIVEEPQVIKQEPTQSKAYGDEEDEEVIVPQKQVPKVSGVQVRMQEEIDTTPEDETDFEVPFEADEK